MGYYFREGEQHESKARKINYMEDETAVIGSVGVNGFRRYIYITYIYNIYIYPMRMMSVIYGPKSLHCYLYNTGPWK